MVCVCVIHTNIQFGGGAQYEENTREKFPFCRVGKIKKKHDETNEWKVWLLLEVNNNKVAANIYQPILFAFKTWNTCGKLSKKLFLLFNFVYFSVFFVSHFDDFNFATFIVHIPQINIICKIMYYTCQEFYNNNKNSIPQTMGAPFIFT